MLSLYFDDLFLLLWIGVMAYAGKTAAKQKVTVLGQEEEHYGWPFAIIVFFPIFRLAVYGDPRGDVGTYISNFYLTEMSVSQVFENWDNISKGPGFVLIEMLTKEFVGGMSTDFRFVVGLLHAIPLIFIYRKYSVDYVFSVFLFIASMTYEGWMMNGIRQFIAATLIFAATPLLLKKRYIPLALVILMAYTVHSSALVMFPVFVAAIFKPWKKITILALIVFVAALTVYVSGQDYMSDEYASFDDGANPIRVVIALIPTFFAFIGRKKIAEKNNYLINICVNMSIISAMMYGVAIFTSGVTVGRLPGYTGIYNFILIPYLCSEVFDEKKSERLRLFFILFYIAYFFADLMFI